MNILWLTPQEQRALNELTPEQAEILVKFFGIRLIVEDGKVTGFEI